MKKHKNTYFVALNKTNNTVIVTKTKAAVADHLGIHPETVARRLKRTSSYHDDYCSIWSDNIITPIKRGFARNVWSM